MSEELKAREEAQERAYVLATAEAEHEAEEAARVWRDMNGENPGDDHHLRTFSERALELFMDHLAGYGHLDMELPEEIEGHVDRTAELRDKLDPAEISKVLFDYCCKKRGCENQAFGSEHLLGMVMSDVYQQAFASGVYRGVYRATYDQSFKEAFAGAMVQAHDDACDKVYIEHMAEKAAEAAKEAADGVAQMAHNVAEEHAKMAALKAAKAAYAEACFDGAAAEKAVMAAYAEAYKKTYGEIYRKAYAATFDEWHGPNCQEAYDEVMNEMKKEEDA